MDQPSAHRDTVELVVLVVYSVRYRTGRNLHTSLRLLGICRAEITRPSSNNGCVCRTKLQKAAVFAVVLERASGTMLDRLGTGISVAQIQPENRVAPTLT